MFLSYGLQNDGGQICLPKELTSLQGGLQREYTGVNTRSRSGSSSGVPRNILVVMAEVTCPFCGAKVRLRQFLQTANKPFCAKCGWNLDRAQSDLAGTAKTMRLFATAFLLGIAL